jgi:hypothetical protein
MTAAYFEDHPTDPEKVIFRKPPLDQGPDYERGFVDGMLYQTQSSVYKAVNAMTQPTYYIPNKDARPWVGLTYEDMVGLQKELFDKHGEMVLPTTFAMAIEAKLKEKNT